MNYNKVIKDLKERNDKLQEQYRLRDIRCIYLEYENEMLKSDFEAQYELTKKYAEENQKYKEVIDKVLEDIKEYKEMGYSKYYENEIEIELIDKILKVLGDD